MLACRATGCAGSAVGLHRSHLDDAAQTGSSCRPGSRRAPRSGGQGRDRRRRVAEHRRSSTDRHRLAVLLEHHARVLSQSSDRRDFSQPGPSTKQVDEAVVGRSRS